MRRAWSNKTEDNVKTIKIPGSVLGIGSHAFEDMITTLDSFQFGDSNNPSQLACFGGMNFMNNDISSAFTFALSQDISITVSYPKEFWFYGSSVEQMQVIVSNFIRGNAQIVFELFNSIPEDKHYFIYNDITHNSYDEVLNWNN